MSDLEHQPNIPDDEYEEAELENPDEEASPEEEYDFQGEEHGQDEQGDYEHHDENHDEHHDEHDQEHDDEHGEFAEEGYEEPQFDQSSIPADYSRFHSGLHAHSHMRTSVDDSGLDYRDHSDVYPSLRKVASGTSSFSRRSFDDSYYADARMQKIAQTEAEIRQEMFKECTFRPKIKSLPATYGPLKENGTPFVDRVIKWEKEKKMERDKKAQLAQKASETECTFKPHINKNSILAAKEMHDSPLPASERLYRSFEDVNKERRQRIEQGILHERKLEDQECTFQPKLVTKHNPQFQHVQSKVKVAIKDPNALRKVELPAQEFPFKPKVNKIKPNMCSAQVYVSTNVVERLTKPIVVEPVNKADDHKTFDDSFEATQVIDAATFIGSLQSGPPPYQTPAAKSLRNGKLRLSNSSVDSSKSPPNSKSKQKQTAAEFEMFLERQKIRIDKREERLKKAAEAMTPKFKPKISSKSKEIATHSNIDHGSSTFLDRVQKEIEKRKEFEQKVELMIDKECTFAPQINKKAAQKPSRSRAELSFGDKFKLDAKLKMLQIEVEQQNSAGLTFKPQLSKRAKETQGKLRLSDDPSAYLEWIKNKRQEQEKERLLEQKRREDEEAMQCTFTPKTTQCPAYIKRIAESISRMKEARGRTDDHQRPEWK